MSKIRNSTLPSNVNTKTQKKCYLPLFQLYWFLTSTSPLGLNGPFSENAPTPKEEQPGPANKKRNHKDSNFRQWFNVSLCYREKKVKFSLVSE